jgi:ribonuclease J
MFSSHNSGNPPVTPSGSSPRSPERRPFHGGPSRHSSSFRRPASRTNDTQSLIHKAIAKNGHKDDGHAPASTNLPIKEGLAREERPREPRHERKGGRKGGKMGGAFSRPVRLDTYKNKPYLKTGSDKDLLGGGTNDRLRIAVLGGNEEVGRNMTMIEYGNDIILIDMGLQFPDEDMPGVDFIIPNVSCLKGKERNVRGVIITHAHLDHIGGIPYIMPMIGNPPIFSTDLTCAIIKKRQEDHRDKPPLNLNVIKSNDVLRLGSFTIEFFGVAHSVPSSMGVIVNTPCGIIVHTGDFKIDHNASAHQETDKMVKLGERNVLALLVDSTNASKPGRQITETVIQHNIDEIIANAKGRVIIGTFSSMIARVGQIIKACERQGRKVAVEGFSMKSNIMIAQELGYMNIQKGTLIETKEAVKLPREKVAIICTGAQGEERAVLMRIANREHSLLEIEPGDTVVFSSSVIPGNERSVQRVKDTLYREGADVVHYQMMDVHAGGHAQQDDLIEAHQMIKPKYIVPIEGHYAFLMEHQKAAIRGGFAKDHIFIADNGQIIEFDKQRNGQLTNKKLDTSYVFVDGLGVGDTNHVVLRDRQELAGDGVVVALALVNQKTGELIQMPDLISRGFIHMKNNEDLILQARKKVAFALKDKDPRASANASYLKDKVRDELGDFLFHKTQRRPMILPIIVEV